MERSLVRAISALVFLAFASASVFAQGGTTSSLSGTVVDSDGGVLPGVTVVVKNNATGASLSTVTNSTGAYSLPALSPGTYTVTISLSSFKTVVMNDVALAAATPANIKTMLAVGAMSETVEVKGGVDIVQTQSSTISTTLNVDEIAKLPASTRNALNFITFLPGVETTTTNRGSTVMGLPQSTIAITLDGVNIQDNYLKSSDGFFARVTPRQDAVEQVTVSSATPGADAAGQGAVQIQFVTRSGTNLYKGTLYHYHRDSTLNSNSWFNERNGLGKDQVTLNQFGASEGGPVVLPGLYDGRGKAFFFVNHEELRLPTQVARTRTIMNPTLQQGIYTLATGQQFNVFGIAAQAGQTTLADPTVAALLAKITAATQTTGLIRQDTGKVNTLAYLYQSPASQHERQPTVRMDLNVGQKHRLTGTYNWEVVVRDPDYLNSAEARFPGFANARYYASYRPSTTETLRSTISANLVNELKFGFTWGGSFFGLRPGDSKYESPDQFTDQAGFSLGFPSINGDNLTSATTETGPSARAADNWSLDEKLSWLKGKHNFSFGGGVTQVRLWLNNQTMVPSIGFGLATTDPAANLFTTTSMPGATSTELTNAGNLYAFLTGRVTSINGTSRLDSATNQYVYNGPGVQRGQMNEFSLYGQDSWRVSPTFTLNAGLRWELQLPFTATTNYATATFASLCGMSGEGPGIDGRLCNLAQPGTLTGVKPQYIAYTQGTRGYNIDWNNIAPNIGAAWRPNVRGGLGRLLLGDPDQATVRAAYSVAYNRNGIGDLSGVYSSNPGLSYTANRNSSNGNLLAAGQTFLLLRDRSLLGPPATCAGAVTVACVPASPVLPADTTLANSVNIFDPNLQVSFSRSYSIGLQRSLSKNMAVEARYVGTRNVGGWTTENWNEPNLTTNGFLNEFKLAQANLLANIAGGKGNTFAYTGAPGTSPLPIFLAYYNAVGKAQAGDTTKYTGSNWTNSTALGYLSVYNPNPSTLGSNSSNNSAQGIFNDATKRANALAAGLASNFFVLNPDVSSANITRSVTFTKYDSLQVELRRRLSSGFQISGNYTYAITYGSSLDSIFLPRLLLKSSNVPHALKGDWTYEIPVGRGRRFGTDMPAWLDVVTGGWEFDGTARFQRRRLSMNGVRLVGMTAREMQDAYKVRIVTDPATGLKNVYMFPDDILVNTRRAFSTSATSDTGYGSLGAPTGRYIAPASYPGCVEVNPGDCGEPRNFYLNGPVFGRVDVSVKKTVSFGRRMSGTVQFDVLNVFNSINFNPVLNPSNSSSTLQVTSAYSDSSNTFDPGGRLGQISWRFNW